MKLLLKSFPNGRQPVHTWRRRCDNIMSSSQYAALCFSSYFFELKLLLKMKRHDTLELECNDTINSKWTASGNDSGLQGRDDGVPHFRLRPNKKLKRHSVSDGLLSITHLARQCGFPGVIANSQSKDLSEQDTYTAR